jgi:hypothetical protein
MRMAAADARERLAAAVITRNDGRPLVRIMPAHVAPRHLAAVVRV